MRRHAKFLKELVNFNIDLTGEIEAILENPQEWAEDFAENAILSELPRYQKAKKMGEGFAREITS